MKTMSQKSRSSNSKKNKQQERNPEIHMENINLPEEFDDISEDYWEDTSLFMVRTANKGEDGEKNSGKGKTTNLLAMMADKDEDDIYDDEDYDLSSGLSSFSLPENDSESEFNISPVKSPTDTPTPNFQDLKSRQTVKVAAEKLNEVTRKMFTSPTTSSLTLHQLSEQFYYAYREFVLSIEEGASKKANIESLGHIIEELKAITETSSHLLLVVNAASVNPSGKEKISSAAKAVMDCIDQVIAACSWETENYYSEDKCDDLETSESLDSAVNASTEEQKMKSYEDDSRIDVLIKPNVCVKTNHEIIRDGVTVNENYQVCTENTTATTNKVIKDKTVIKEQKLTTDDVVTIKHDVISEHETVTRRPPISPRKTAKNVRQMKKRDVKNQGLPDEEFILFEKSKHNKESFTKDKPTHTRDLSEGDVNICREIIVDKEMTENSQVSKEQNMTTSKRTTREKSSPFEPYEFLNLPQCTGNRGISVNKMATTEKAVSTDDLHLRYQETFKDTNNYLKYDENMSPIRKTENRRLSTAEIGVSTDVKTRERSMSTDRNIKAQKQVMTDEIVTRERGVLTNSSVLSQKGIMTDEIFVKHKGISTKKGSPAQTQISPAEQMGFINRETPVRRASPIRRKSISEIMLVTDEGINRESSVPKKKEVSKDNVINVERRIIKDSEILAHKSVSAEKIFHEEQEIATNARDFSEKEISMEKLITEKRIAAESHEFLDKETLTEKSTTTEKEMSTDEICLSHKGFMTAKVLTKEMGVDSDRLMTSEKGVTTDQVFFSTEKIKTEGEVVMNRDISISESVAPVDIPNIEFGVINDSLIVKDNRYIYKKGVETEPQVQEYNYVEDKKMVTDWDNSTEKSFEDRGTLTEPFSMTQKYTEKSDVATDVEFLEPKCATEERGVTANITVPREKSEMINSEKTERSVCTDPDLSYPNQQMSERGMTTDPCPEIWRIKTEERSVGTDPEVTSQRQAANEVGIMTEKVLTTDTAVLTEKCVTPEKIITRNAEDEIPKNHWRASDIDTNTDVSTFRSLSEHYSKESDESEEFPTEMINLTDEDSGPNFKLTFCLPQYSSTTTKTISIYDLLPDESTDSVDDETDTNELPLTQLLKQIRNNKRNSCFNICNAIKGGEEDFKESVKEPVSKQELNMKNNKLDTELQQSTIVSKASQTEIACSEGKLTEDTSNDTADNSGLTNETPSKKNYALYRALVELKWAKTSIHRLESEKKLLQSQLEEVMRKGFQKEKEQLQQLMQSESLLEKCRQQHDREYQALARKKEELSENLNKLHAEKHNLLEKLTQTEKCCEIAQNKMNENVNTYKKAEMSFSIEKKELKNIVAKLKQELKTEQSEKDKLKEVLKTTQVELNKLNEELEKSKVVQRKQTEQLQEAKNSSNRLLQRTNSDLFSMQKIQKTLHDNVQRLEKEKSVLEFELRCETNKTSLLQKDIDALWKECNHRRSSRDDSQKRRQTFPQETSQRDILWPQTQTPSHAVSKPLMTLQQKLDLLNRLSKGPHPESQVEKSQGNVLLQQSMPVSVRPLTNTRSAPVKETECSPHQPTQQLPASNERRRLVQSQFKIPSRPFIHAGAVKQAKTKSNKSQSEPQLQSQDLPISEDQKDIPCLKSIMSEQKLIKSKYEYEQARNRRLQRKILYMKASEQKKKQLLISKFERERKRIRLIMEKYKQNSRQATQCLHSADAMLDIEREKNNVLKHEITTIKTQKEKQTGAKFVNSSQDLDQLGTCLTQVHLGQTIERVNSYLEQQQMEYQLQMAAKEKEIAMEKSKLQEDLHQLRINYEKILSLKTNEFHRSNENSESPHQSSALNHIHTPKFFSPNPTWKPSSSKDLTYCPILPEDLNSGGLQPHHIETPVPIQSPKLSNVNPGQGLAR